MCIIDTYLFVFSLTKSILRRRRIIKIQVHHNNTKSSDFVVLIENNFLKATSHNVYNAQGYKKTKTTSYINTEKRSNPRSGKSAECEYSWVVLVLITDCLYTEKKKKQQNIVAKTVNDAHKKETCNFIIPLHTAYFVLQPKRRV